LLHIVLYLTNIYLSISLHHRQYPFSLPISFIIIHLCHLLYNTSELSAEDRYAIIALDKHLHWNQERIALQIHCNQSAVSRTLKRWKEYETVDDLPGRGKKPFLDTSDTDNNPITNTIRSSRNSNSNQLKSLIKEECNITISARTIRNLRQQLGFRPVHYRRRPKLSDNSIKKRLHYCLDNLDNDWKDIIFTDESMFILSDEHEIIWKRPGSPMIEKPVAEYPEKFMVWGGVWWDGKTELCFIEGNVDQFKYQEIINKYLIRPHLHLSFEMLQDGATAHTAHTTLDFLDEKGVDYIQNPPSSPELNPIEKVWGWIKHEANKRIPNNLEEFKQLIQKLWNEIPQTLIQQFISHNSTVVNDIIQSEGSTITEPNRHHKRQSA
jgi:transposase